jgi:hypothetical protein
MIETSLITITCILACGLIISAIIKNYHLELFYSIVNDKSLDTFHLILRIIGSRFTGLVWIIPYRIDESTSNKIASIHKKKFNSWSKIFITFWSLTIIWVLIVLAIKN